MTVESRPSVEQVAPEINIQQEAQKRIDTFSSFRNISPQDTLVRIENGNNYLIYRKSSETGARELDIKVDLEYAGVKEEHESYSRAITKGNVKDSVIVPARDAEFEWAHHESTGTLKSVNTEDAIRNIDAMLAHFMQQPQEQSKSTAS